MFECSRPDTEDCWKVVGIEDVDNDSIAELKVGGVFGRGLGNRGSSGIVVVRGKHEFNEVGMKTGRQPGMMTQYPPSTVR